MISGFFHLLSASQRPLWRIRSLFCHLRSAGTISSPKGPPNAAMNGRANTDKDTRSAWRCLRVTCATNDAELPDMVIDLNLPTEGSTAWCAQLSRVTSDGRVPSSSAGGRQIHVGPRRRPTAQQGWANSTFMLLCRSPMNLPIPSDPVRPTDQTTARISAPIGREVA